VPEVSGRTFGHTKEQTDVDSGSGSSLPVVNRARRMGQLSASHRHCCDAVAASRRRKSARPWFVHRRLAHTIRLVGDIHHDAGRLALAEPCYEEALTLYRSHRHTAPPDPANVLRPFAILQETLGGPEQAILLWSEAKALYATLNLREGVAESSEHLGRLGA